MPSQKKWVVDETGFHAVTEFVPADKTAAYVDDTYDTQTDNTQNSDESEVQLLEGKWLPGEEGFQFNKKCKAQVKAKFLKETCRRKVTLSTSVEYEGEEEDLVQQVEAELNDDGIAEGEVMLYYGDKYSDALREKPDAKCYYKFKATHNTAKNEVESENLEMPQSQEEQVDLKKGNYDDKGVESYNTKKVDGEGYVKGFKVKELQENFEKVGVKNVGKVDGDFGDKTEKAVIAFQKAAKEKSRKQKDGTIAEAEITFEGKPNGVFDSATSTEIKMWIEKGYLIPGPEILTFPDTNLKYQRTKMELSSCLNTLPSQLRDNFKNKVTEVIKEMHKLGIAFGIKDGVKAGIRTFEAQYNIPSTSTKAGPGESYHNYGFAVDLGVLNWVDEDGNSYDDFWLGKMDKISKYKGFSKKIWEKRNSFCKSGIYSLSWETIHLQGVKADASGRSALVKVLNKVAENDGWKYRKSTAKKYECTFSAENQWKNIGTSKQMWKEQATNSTSDQKKKIKKHMQEAEKQALEVEL